LCGATPLSTTETGSCESEPEVELELEVEGRRELVFKGSSRKELLITLAVNTRAVENDNLTHPDSTSVSVVG
jgi:predicted transglutaminase-like cysteine proteinase